MRVFFFKNDLFLFETRDFQVPAIPAVNISQGVLLREKISPQGGMLDTSGTNLKQPDGFTCSFPDMPWSKKHVSFWWG